VAALRIRNQTREVHLPIQLETSTGSLRVQGNFALRQSDFGITPLSLALGALQVQDEVRIRFDLRATPG
jgi:polyisoprenoid-binding protein YceI